LGEPGADSVTAAVGSPLTFSSFSNGIGYAQLGSVLTNSGVSAALQAVSDFIAFDVNGTTGGFEGTNWSFDDGAGGMLSTSNNFGSLGTGIIFNGDISDADYTALFGESTAFGFVGFVLFDLGAQGVDVAAAGFTATLEGLDLTGTGEPDISGLGVLVPEPNLAGLLALALTGLAATRRWVRL